MKCPRQCHDLRERDCSASDNERFDCGSALLVAGANSGFERFDDHLGFELWAMSLAFRTHPSNPSGPPRSLTWQVVRNVGSTMLWSVPWDSVLNCALRVTVHASYLRQLHSLAIICSCTIYVSIASLNIGSPRVEKWVLHCATAACVERTSFCPNADS